VHDIKLIRENPEVFDQGLKNRQLTAMSSVILEADTERRKFVAELQELQARRNELASLIGAARQAGNDTSDLERESSDIKAKMQSLEEKTETASQKLDELLSGIPNIPLSDVPLGPDETANKCVRIVGEPPKFDFIPKPHYELGEDLGMLDFKIASKLSGSRFVLMRGRIAQMERALKSFMLDHHTQKFGYQEVYVPLLVNAECMYGTGQLPKFSGDSFVTTDGRWLIPTSEVSLTNMCRDMIIKAEDLPIRLTAYSACFRSEAGAAGRDTRGMIRNHQFSKVELVSVVHPDNGEEELERMTSVAESILQSLGLAYRVMMLSSGDMGFSAKKTYDIEVWIPSENIYREISSCSLCGDFQARRMGARYKSASEKGYVSTLNGSGLAIGRTIVAILENYQLSNGNIRIPEALVPYMNGIKEISKNDIR
jgi:seryl-tRNA synthetase